MTWDSNQWWDHVIEKYGSEEAAREFFRQGGLKASHPGTGGFKHMKENDPQKLKEVSAKGGRKSKRSASKAPEER